MLKACLIIVIALGIGALAISQLHVAPKINQLETSLNDAEDRAQRAQAAQRSAEQGERQAKAESETLRGELSDLQDQLEQTTLAFQQQRGRANELESDLRTSEGSRVEAQRQLAQWRALGVEIENVQRMKKDLQGAQQEIGVLNSEKDILALKINQLEFDLSKYKGPDVKVELPTGLSGSVVAVDPQWDFVVINIGENHGVKEFGELMVSRNGKLVGKVQITTVENSESIGNMLPEWKQADVQVGDMVLY